MVPPSSRDGLRKAVIIALYPVVWVLAHKAAVAMNVGPGVSIWYPPAGLTFAFLLRFPRFWPLAYVGIGTVVLLGPYAVTTPGAWLSWLIPPTGYVVGVALLRRWLGGSLDLSRQAHIHRFIAASLATPAIVAAINVLNFCADGASRGRNTGRWLPASSLAMRWASSPSRRPCCCWTARGDPTSGNGMGACCSSACWRPP